MFTLRRSGWGATFLAIALAAVAVACGSTEVVTETVIVEKAVIQTVIVEKAVEQTVIVEQTVEVEKIVQQTVVVERTVISQVIVTPTQVLPATPTAVPAQQPAPQPKNARGELLWVLEGVSGATAGGFNAVNICCEAHRMSVTEALWKPTRGNPAVNLLAESWVLASDLSSATVKIKKGIPFHGDFGEVTAEDVAWSINDTNPNLSATLGSGSVSVTNGSGTWAGFLGQNAIEAIDTYTVRLAWAAFNPVWQVEFFGQEGLGASIVSKKAFEQMGREWNLDHIVGTGPFQLTEWSRDDREIFEALDSHWRVVPEVKKITRIAVPDQTVRQAMMKTGEADIAEISLPNVPDMQRVGMLTTSSGVAAIHTVMFPGNLWEANHPTSGEPLDILTFRGDLEWLGNPWSPDDSNNPAGMTDMEQARLVRVAMSHAIDRELMNEVVFEGLGWVNYLPYFDINNPRWNPDWEFEYDPELAMRLLDQAGFPAGSDGSRFQIPLFGWPVGTTRANIANAIAAMWEDVGISVEVLHYSYTVYRPTLVARSTTIPWIDTGPVENRSATTPWDWPRGIQMSALTRGGKSHGMELPQATEAYLAVSGESDPLKRTERNLEFAAFLHDWAPGIGLVVEPAPWVFNPNSIKSWEMEVGVRWRFNSPENIVLP